MRFLLGDVCLQKVLKDIRWLRDYCVQKQSVHLEFYIGMKKIEGGTKVCGLT